MIDYTGDQMKCVRQYLSDASTQIQRVRDEQISRVDVLTNQDSRPRDGFFVGARKGLLTILRCYPPARAEPWR